MGIEDNGLSFVKAEVRENRSIVQPTHTASEAVKQEPAPAKKKGGRKSISHDLKYKVDFVKRDKAIHERTIADITIYSEDKALVRELAVRQFLFAYDITEDYAAKILCFIYDKSNKIEAEKVYLLGIQVIAESLGLSYPTVQKTVKKLRKKNVIAKSPVFQNAYTINAEADRFFKSISNNAQILLTFEAIEEEQLEAVNEDGTVNEEMAN